MLRVLKKGAGLEYRPRSVLQIGGSPYSRSAAPRPFDSPARGLRFEEEDCCVAKRNGPGPPGPEPFCHAPAKSA